MAIHPSAVVDAGSELGERVSVGPFAVVESGVRVGDDCVIGPHAVLHRGARLGARCRVHAGAVVGGPPQDLAFDEAEETWAEIGDDCTLREGATVHRASTRGDRITRVGKGCFLMSLAHVGHDSVVEDRVVMATGAMLGGHVTVGEGCFLGGGAGIHQWVRVGRLCMVGGNSGLSVDLAPFAMSKSCELNALAGVNLVGLRRAGVDETERGELRRAFRTLFLKGLSRSNAIDEIEAAGPGPLVRELIAFVRGSKRGVAG